MPNFTTQLGRKDLSNELAAFAALMETTNRRLEPLPYPHSAGKLPEYRAKIRNVLDTLDARVSGKSTLGTTPMGSAFSLIVDLAVATFRYAVLWQEADELIKLAPRTVRQDDSPYNPSNAPVAPSRPDSPVDNAALLRLCRENLHDLLVEIQNELGYDPIDMARLTTYAKIITALNMTYQTFSAQGDADHA